MLKDIKSHNKLWDFKIMQEIGRGQTGIVYRVLNRKTDTIQALKKIPIGNMTTGEKNETYRQLKTLQKLSHPNVVRYYQSFISAENLYIVMDYANNGDLLNLFAERRHKFNHFKESQLWEMFQQLAAGVCYLHEHKIIHRDIKLQNIFVHSRKDRNKNEKKQFLIGDLGLSKLVHEKSISDSKRVGTPIYFAPEMIQHLPYSFEVDLWALGCVFYSLVNLKHPFEHAILENLADIILAKPLKPIKSFYSKKICTVIEGLLEKNSSKRINSKELINMIEDKPIENQTVKVFNNKYYVDLKNDAEEVKKIQKQTRRSQSTNRDSKMMKMSCLNEQEFQVAQTTGINLKELLKTIKCMRPSSIQTPYKPTSLIRFEEQLNTMSTKQQSLRKDTPTKVFSRNKAFSSISRPLSASFKKNRQNDFVF